MNRRYSQPLIANSEAELQMHINNALRHSKKPVIVHENHGSMNSSINSNNNLNQHLNHQIIANHEKHFKTIPYENVQINNDADYEIIHKKSGEVVQQMQNVTLKYLKPPPVHHGDLVIRQESDIQLPPISPVIVREQPEPAMARAPIIIREEPPLKPEILPREEVVVPGRTLPPPPRQKIIHRLPQVPAPPAEITIERWLGYQEQTRQVKFIPGKKLAPMPAPRNVKIIWEAPSVQIKQQLNFTGVMVVDPDQYRARFGSNLVSKHQLPPIVSQFVRNIPSGEVLAANQINRKPRLVGDVNALALLNSSRAEKRYSATPLSEQFSFAQTPTLYNLPNGFNINNEQAVSLISSDNQFGNIISDSANYMDPSIVSNFAFEEHNNGYISNGDEVVNSVDM